MSLAVSKDTLLKRARLYPDVIRVHLDEARLCVNCDTIHTGSSCPTCASDHFFLLSAVIGRMPQNLHLKKNVESHVIHASGVDSSMLGVKPLAAAKKGADFRFMFLHLVSWLKCSTGV